jgi:organic hydroperoxide reductase OsmC/OhrA
MSENLHFSVELESREGYEFVVRFDRPKGAELLVDEPPPLGAEHGPNAERLLAAAVANCLSASLLFCLRGKFKQNPGPIRAMATGTLERNEKGRLRIAAIDVVLSLSEPKESLKHLDRCLEQFEGFCVVTQSVRRGIPVSVKVLDEAGVELV